jgi:MoaA/NifB/PqqE/SkfB family radical SAM enzyme
MSARALASRAKQALKRLLYAVLPRRALVALVRRKPPRFATLEATITCNLSCPLCVTHVMPRGHRHLSPEHVADVVAGARGRLRFASFHLMGEPLLNPEIFALVRICRAAGVWTMFSTNGMRLDRHLDEILDSGLDKISIAIDGADAADYARYRVGGDFDTVLRNVRALVAAKARRGARTPVIQLQTIMFSYNEDREAEVRALLAGLGADEIELKRPSYFHDVSVARGYGLEAETARWTADARRFLAGVDRDPSRRWLRANAGGRLFRDLPMCPQLERAAVLSDGRVVACCMDAMGVTAFGDLHRERFADVWRGPARRALLERFVRRELDLCRLCTLSEVPVVDRRVPRSAGTVESAPAAAEAPSGSAARPW